jgi:hypothetical protein
MASKRELSKPYAKDARFVRRDPNGHFTDSQDDVGRSLTADRRRKAKRTAPRVQGGRGDRAVRSGSRR